MTPGRTYDASHLPVFSISSHAPLWWGQVLMAAIEGTMFCILIAAYFYTRLRIDVWPPPGDQFPHLTLPSLTLIPLILSCVGAYWASEAAKKNSRPGMLLGHHARGFHAFDEFFKSVRSVRASFALSGLQVDGATADAKLNGTYDFVTSSGRNEHQPLTLQASLRKDGSSWRFVWIK